MVATQLLTIPYQLLEVLVVQQALDLCIVLGVGWEHYLEPLSFSEQLLHGARGGSHVTASLRLPRLDQMFPEAKGDFYTA